MSLLAWLKSLLPKKEPTLEEKFKATFGDSRCFLCGVYRFGQREFGQPFDPPPHKCVEDMDQKGYRT